MRTWHVLDGYSLDGVKHATASDLYITASAARAFATSIGYTACVIEQLEGGARCFFYRGRAEDLWGHKVRSPGRKLMMYMQADAAAGSKADASGEEEPWVVVEAGIDPRAAAVLAREQDARRKEGEEPAQPEAAVPAARDAVVVVEHERWLPFTGWAPPQLPTDPHHYALLGAATGRAEPAPSPPHDLPPPPGRQWAMGCGKGWHMGHWEYALDFYLHASFFHHSCGIAHIVRRRRWERSHVPAA